MKKILATLTILLLLGAPSVFAGGGAEQEADHHDHHDHEEHGFLTPADLHEADLSDDALLDVVASTQLIADAVANVGGDRIQLITLMDQGQDPHGFEPTPRQMAQVSDSDVVFINGFALEEGLLPVLENVSDDVPMVEVSQRITAIAGDDHDHEHEGEAEEDHHDEHHHEDGEEHHDDDDHHEDGDEHHDEHHEEGEHHHAIDPHTWMSVRNVISWVEVVRDSLVALDPQGRDEYIANADAYIAELRELDEWVVNQLSTIPEENRVIVADHKVFGYFGRDYDFEQGEAVIPSFSTNSEPSPSHLAELVETLNEHPVPAVFVGDSTDMAIKDMFENLKEAVSVEPLVLQYSANHFAPDFPDYVSFFQYNVGQLVSGLAGK